MGHLPSGLIPGFPQSVRSIRLLALNVKQNHTRKSHIRFSIATVISAMQYRQISLITASGRQILGPLKMNPDGTIYLGVVKLSDLGINSRTVY